MRRLDLPCDDLNDCPNTTGPAHRASISGSQRPGSDDGPSATLGLLPMGFRGASVPAANPPAAPGPGPLLQPRASVHARGSLQSAAGPRYRR